MCDLKCKIEENVWFDLDFNKPVVGMTYLTTGLKDGKWTIPLVATYHKSGIFIMGYSFHGERVFEIAVETKPTHFSKLPKLPNGKFYNWF